MFKKKMSARELVYLFAGIERHPWGFLLCTCTLPIMTTLLAMVVSWCR
jgi:hypothetical protein